VETDINSKTDCVHKIESAWMALNTYLAGLTDAQMTEQRDALGWTIKDHLANLATWEDSIVMLFQGRPRYETLGVEKTLYEQDKLDEINAAIQRHWKQAALAEVMNRLGRVTSQMIALVQSLTDAELNQTMEERFAQLSQGDERKLANVILGNSEYHFLEHLAWIREIAEQQPKSFDK
jgi:hypothetical protein